MSAPNFHNYCLQELAWPQVEAQWAAVYRGLPVRRALLARLA